jgi:hypothetical protein
MVGRIWLDTRKPRGRATRYTGRMHDLVRIVAGMRLGHVQIVCCSIAAIATDRIALALGCGGQNPCPRERRFPMSPQNPVTF